MQTVIQNLIQTLTKAGRTTIDFTNEGDVAFFTPLMNEAVMTNMTNTDKKNKKTKAVKAVKADKDKKNLNSYMVYCEWARKNTEFTDKQPKEISRRLGEMWRALTTEEKADYKKQADENKRPVEARDDSPKRAESPAADKPKKPLTSYIKFSNAMRDSVKATVSNPQDVSRRLGEMWRALSDEEKAKWKGGDVSAEPVPVIEVKKNEVAPVMEEKKDEPVKDKRDESPKKSKKTKKVKEDVAVVADVASDTESKKEKTKKAEKAEKKSKAKKSDDWDAKMMGF
jgi:hypothetical protein